MISKDEASFLLRDFYSTPYFYHLPKVHKNQSQPARRPIVASIDSVSSGFSQYIDYFLQPLAQNLQSYIRDSTHLLERLAPYSWEDSYLWLSLDVNSLYTSIPYDKAILATQYFLLQDPMLHPNQAGLILDATHICLTHNYFHYNKDPR